MPKISVIIPVYKTDKYLGECLDSILGQSFKDIEIICINDGSPDRCGEILEKYAKENSCINVITQENKGLSVARNVGLDVAKGDWICFVDSDDLLPENALMLLYGLAQKTGSKIIASRSRFSIKEYEKMLKMKDKLEYSLECNEWVGLSDFVRDPKIYSSVWNKLFAKELFRTQRFKDNMYFEDWPLITILFGRVDRYVTTDIPCYVYREDNESITRSSFSLKKINSYIQGIRMVYQEYQGTKQFVCARKRMAVAVKMLVSKVYKSNDKTLATSLLQAINELFRDKIISKSDLCFKTRVRLFLLKLR